MDAEMKEGIPSGIDSLAGLGTKGTLQWSGSERTSAVVQTESLSSFCSWNRELCSSMDGFLVVFVG